MEKSRSLRLTMLSNALYVVTESCTKKESSIPSNPFNTRLFDLLKRHQSLSYCLLNTVNMRDIVCLVFSQYSQSLSIYLNLLSYHFFYICLSFTVNKLQILDQATQSCFLTKILQSFSKATFGLYQVKNSCIFPFYIFY